mmetsp:Transcript_12943/g.20049  ORF Transcript_12943/g.20049 Transcript_12943/m.20049 type:complete len:124 (+) Transcript_12943:49-420(+)
MGDRVFWVSARAKESSILQEKQNSHINRCFNAMTIFKLMAMYMLGLLWLMPLNDHHYSVPFISKETYTHLKQMMAGGKYDTVITRFLFWFVKVFTRNSKKYYQHLKRRGCIVTVWAVNTEEEF